METVQLPKKIKIRMFQYFFVGKKRQGRIWGRSVPESDWPYPAAMLYNNGEVKFLQPEHPSIAKHHEDIFEIAKESGSLISVRYRAEISGCEKGYEDDISRKWVDEDRRAWERYMLFGIGEPRDGLRLEVSDRGDFYKAGLKAVSMIIEWEETG